MITLVQNNEMQFLADLLAEGQGGGLWVAVPPQRSMRADPR